MISKYFIVFVSLTISSFVSSNSIFKENPTGLFEGDIKLSPLQSLNRGVAQIGDSKWPNSTVHYSIDPYSYSTQEIEIIKAGLKVVEDQTSLDGKKCVTFVPRTSEFNYINIFSGDGCWSYVGKLGGGKQDLSLTSRSCTYIGIVAHEMLHALGFWHEHSRPDRDNYIKVNYENIIPGFEHAFNKYPKTDTLGTPYDYSSIMHYESTAFTRNGEATIVSLQPGVSLTGASGKLSLSQIDIQEIRKYYNCQ